MDPSSSNPSGQINNLIYEGTPKLYKATLKKRKIERVYEKPKITEFHGIKLSRDETNILRDILRKNNELNFLKFLDFNPKQKYARENNHLVVTATYDRCKNYMLTENYKDFLNSHGTFGDIKWALEHGYIAFKTDLLTNYEKFILDVLKERILNRVKLNENAIMERKTKKRKRDE
jgi:hypothetical protein